MIMRAHFPSLCINNMFCNLNSGMGKPHQKLCTKNTCMDEEVNGIGKRLKGNEPIGFFFRENFLFTFSSTFIMEKGGIFHTAKE